MIIELVFLLPAIMVCCFVAGFAKGRGRAKRPVQRIELGPNVCQCEHPISFHTRRTGRCEERVGGYRCRCEVYTSPYHVEDL